ncbi:hypothetical protein [Enterobacter sichuanensis]|uniref:hypothetical protein n=1 Tax=Enterobacter sichuanensis TaxID=2071710 RepID=UPI00290FC592|nr:hypothetical protein [Enterobacter sichuanensis]MDU5387362.1 hypothetical protein [Enterobacter sichuanensis]
MWNLVKRLPWRGMVLALVLVAALYGLNRWGYHDGSEDAKRDGDAALSRLQSAFDTYKTEQTTLENAALRAWAKRYQEQVAAGQQINDVTQRWIDEKGKSHPIECVFTRGFVRQYNAALGYDNASVGTGHSDTTAAAGTGTGAASGQPEAADAWLRDSGVSQRDVLANIIDNAKQCRIWRSQINQLLDEREGLQK